MNNSVSLTARKKPQSVDANPIALAKYSYTLEKTSLNKDGKYLPNGVVVYSLVITNTSPTIPITNMSLIDKLSDIKALDAKGNLVPALDTSRVTILGTVETRSSSTGNFNPTSEPNITNISIAPNDKATYLVRTYVNPNIVGEIKNSVTITDRNGNTLEASDTGLTSKPANITITKTALSSNLYSPGSLIKYLITVENTGEGIGYNLNVVDNISSITSLLANASGVGAKDIEGNPVNTWSITASLGSGSTESTSSLLQSGGVLTNLNLNDSKVIVYPSEKINYEVSIITKNTAIGEISNIAQTDGKSSTAVYMPQNTITTGNDSITITKSPIQNEYTPGGTINYSIVVRNLDTKFVNNVSITDALSKLDQNEYTPGGTINYSIVVRNLDTKFVNNVSITDALSKLEALNTNGGLSSVVKSWILNFESKSGNGTAQGEFNYGVSNPGTQDLKLEADIGPGGEIRYDLVITVNPDIVGKIYDENSTGTVVEDGNGISILKLEADIGPGGEIRYDLVITVNPDIVGKIYDENSTGTVVEDGNGISMAPYKLELQKEVNATEYTPGKPVEYTIIVSNTGDGTAVNIPVEDIFSKISTELVTGVQGQAYESTSVTGTIYNVDGSISTTGPDNVGFTGTLVDKDLNVNAILSPGKSIEYKITAVINSLAKGKIINMAKVDGELTSDKGIVTRTTNVTINKSVNKTSYPNNLDSNGNLLGDEAITYTITISNSSESGIAMNVPVKDSISTIKAELLSGGEAPVFKPNWTIKTELNGVGTIVSGAPVVDGKDIDTRVNIAPGGSVGGEAPVFKPNWTIKTELNGVGTIVSGAPVVDGKDIDTRVNIAPGGSVVFTVEGVVNNTSNQIFYGEFSNSIVENGNISTATTSPKMPFLRISKSSTNTGYVSGGEIEYIIVIENIGDGYANDTIVRDNLDRVLDEDKNKAFSSWTITGVAKGYGTTIGKIAANANLDTKVDIAPGGSVTYNIKAQLNKNLSGIITNEVSVQDIQNGNINTASASEANDIAPGGSVTYNIKAQLNKNLSGIITNEVSVQDIQNGNINTASASEANVEEDGTIFIRKTSSTSSINPLSKITYIIDVLNNSKSVVEDIKIVDDLNTIIGDLANEDGTSIKDVKGKAFLSWEIYKGKDKISKGQNDKLNDLIDNLAPQKGVEYKIIATPNPKLLTQKLKNTALVYSEDELVGSSFIENNVLGSSGGVMRGVNLSKYVPGETLIYTIKIAPNGVGYLNNYPINENINKLDVKLMNGTTGNVFFNPTTGKNEFTVEFVENESKISSGTIPIPLSSIKNNTDLTGTVDVAQGDYLVYRITGKIRPDILGDINYKGLVTTYYRQNLTITKQAVGSNYFPGKELTYILRVENNSKGNAGQIPLEDNLSSIQVESSKGGNIQAFVPGTIKVKNIKVGGYGASAPRPTDESNINVNIDVPVNGYIQYEVSGQIADTAVGTIINELDVDEDTVSASSSSPQNRFLATKTLDRYLDVDGVTGVSTGYVPGGYIQYTVKIVNQNGGILNNYPVKDLIGSINTTLANGKLVQLL